MLSKKISWQDPIIFAQRIANNYSQENPHDSLVFLNSQLSDNKDKSISYLAIFSKEKLITDDFFMAKKVISDSKQKWFGYFSYEIANQFENFQKTNQSDISKNKIHFEQFHLIFEFNHQKRILTAYFSNQHYLDCVLNYLPKKNTSLIFKIKNFSSNFSDQSYLKTIGEIRHKIAQGDLFQLNLTRKFFGEFVNKIDLSLVFNIFVEHSKLSATNYSSFFKFGDLIIISASPELFFKVKNKKILSCPIKGTASRSSDKKIDAQNLKNLKNSTKECAENLMIVDLVRNDLSRVCEPSTIKVKKLFNISAYKTIYHLSSEIHGKIAKEFSIFDAIQACFPAGSMTGAPKIKSMEVLSGFEKINRGIYSGAIGYLKSNNELNLAVVIRTLIINKDRFEFQVGGAITFDSDAEAELEETYSKASAIMKILQLKKINFS